MPTDPWTSPLRKEIAMKIFLPRSIYGRLVDATAAAAKYEMRLNGRRVSMAVIIRSAILRGVREARADPVRFAESIDFDLTADRDVQTNLRLDHRLHADLIRTAGIATATTGRTVSAHCLILSTLATALRSPEEIYLDTFFSGLREQAG